VTKRDLSCDFCSEFEELQGCSDRRIVGFRNDFVVLATLGCFREGYCLYMPIEHERSFASLGKKRLEEIEGDIEHVRQNIADEYSASVVVAEHGPGLTDRGASCCDHAHIHMIPVDNMKEVLVEFERYGGKPQVLESFSDLARYEVSPYIYLSCRTGQYLVWENANAFQRQFVRRICAELDGLGMMCNWRIHPFHDNMLRTAERLRKRFQENLALVSR